ncbi:MAG TPA: hypothetical protein PKI94_06895 [Candidatus Gastranaerophilaceae bacterium]|nr:hypothetical protein [Candidatus Gastranaerophilaceae bacterium]
MTKFERCDAKCLLQKAGRLPDGIKISKNPVKNFAYFMKNFINNYKLIRKSIKARIGK